MKPFLSTKARSFTRVFALVILMMCHARAQSITEPYTFTTIAGQAPYGSTDGASNIARFFTPSGTAFDSAGNLFVADYDNNTIREITPNGIVSTLAGLARSAGAADGVGSAARFNQPRGVAVDSANNVFVVDT